MDLAPQNTDTNDPQETASADDEPEGSSSHQTEHGQIAVHLQVPHFSASSNGLSAPKDSLQNKSLDQWLLNHLIDILNHLSASLIDQFSLEFVVVDDEMMCSLHDRFLNDPTTTDVLTFNLLEEIVASETDKINLDGEIYVCLDQAKREAQQRHHDWPYELLLYCLHGILHLAGYDDHDEDDYRKMHQMEDEVLSKLGIGPIFLSNQDRSA